MRNSHNCLLAIISIPLVGSSNKIIFEFPIKAKAIHNFLFCPPDNVLHNAVLLGAKSILVINSFISCWFTWLPLILHIYSKCSSTVKCSKKISSCWHKPIFSYKYFLSVTIDLPSNNISPSFGSYIPDIIFIKVVLPAPLCPSRQYISSVNNSPLKFFTAFKSSNDFDTLTIFKHWLASNFFLFVSDNSWKCLSKNATFNTLSSKRLPLLIFLETWVKHDFK